jgi:hypothetical protein
MKGLRETTLCCRVRCLSSARRLGS